MIRFPAPVEEERSRAIDRLTVMRTLESGSAFKEQGLDALCFYARTKTVAIAFGA
jgi:hypothetical protein